jgi:hypothetical protein
MRSQRWSPTGSSRWSDIGGNIIIWLMVALAILLVVGFVFDPGNEPGTKGGPACTEAQIADSANYPNC